MVQRTFQMLSLSWVWSFDFAQDKNSVKEGKMFTKMSLQTSLVTAFRYNRNFPSAETFYGGVFPPWFLHLIRGSFRKGQETLL